MASLKDEECRSKFRQRVSIHVGVRTWKKLCDAESFTKCIQDAEKKTLAQKIDAPTRFRSILDVVLSSGSSISDIEILTPFDKSDHIVVSFKFDFNTDQIYLPMPDFSCVNYSELRKFLARVDWLEVFDNCQSVVEMYRHFSLVMYGSLATFVPLKFNKNCVPTYPLHLRIMHLQI
ncbi:hypothetical protein RB195_011135 [Necator americanus]|uniref:Uncharacterized protein n=1 Tax=Necator americanus TaxID=51031 RepID=A0ABR1D134_NECAM